MARAVATAPHPLWPSQIAAQMSLSTQKVTALLRKPIFTRTVDGSYLLGRPTSLPTDG